MAENAREIVDATADGQLASATATLCDGISIRDLTAIEGWALCTHAADLKVYQKLTRGDWVLTDTFACVADTPKAISVGVEGFQIKVTLVNSSGATNDYSVGIIGRA